MMGISLNCNGLGGSSKHDWIKELVSKYRPAFFGIQETKLESVSQAIIRNLWPGIEGDFVASGSLGASGGILTMWDSNVFSKEIEFIDRNFVGVIGSWTKMQGKVGILNVYAPQDSHLKEVLWSHIEDLLGNFNASWIVFGDFNVEAGNLRDASVLVLPRSYSDHCPILLKVGSLNFGPKPFKVFDKWLKMDEFTSLITSYWAHIPNSQPHDILLKNKLRSLRLEIKNWAAVRVESENRHREELNKKLLAWDKKAEEGDINEHDILKRDEWIMDLLQIDRLRNEDMKQKCRFRWAVEGDENSRFFHSSLRNRYTKYSLKGIHINGTWVESPRDIKQADMDHYAARFKESYGNRPLLESNLFRKLSTMDASFLKSDFTIEEVKEAVWDCPGSKAPGPDGFNFNFIKTYWEVIKPDFWYCIRHFGKTRVLKKGCNPSFTVLIPKKIDPISFLDYRPICLIGCVYKVISKLLASRLARVIDSVISPNQSTFIKGRQILDGCLVANEIIRMAKLEDQNLLIFKVDFEKAFDSVNWNFLLDVMRQMGFGLKWRKWIASCLSSASISVLVNGSPSNEFFMERGLRQGDLLSPFLFLIVAEALQVTILNACDIGFYKGVRLSNSGLNVSLLQFADDALLFGEWSRLNASNLINILKCFEMGSGLKVNLDKSRIFGVGVPDNDVSSVASSLGCAHGILPFIYLGLPVGRRMRFSEGWQGIIDQFRDRLSLWKAKTLLVGGRLTLIKSVLDIIKAIKHIEGIDFNFRSSFIRKVADGADTFFWLDPWCGDGTRLKDKFPRLFALESIKDCMVKDRGYIDNESWISSWAWRIPPRGRALDDINTLGIYLNVVVINPNGRDKWSWSYEASGCFKVNVLTKAIEFNLHGDHSLGSHHKWNSWIPKKVNIMAWRASLDRLATRSNLMARGVILLSINCPFCGLEPEVLDHVLVRCHRVCGIWRKVWSWWNLPPPVTFPSFSAVEVASGKVKFQGGAILSKATNGVFLITLWTIWNWRNRLIHATGDDIGSIMNDDIFSGIQRMSKLWMLIAVDGWMGRNVDIKDGVSVKYIMGEPLSPDRVFNFLMDEPYPAHDFFTLASLPKYAGNPNNNNGWLAADDYLLGELEAMVDEQMVMPAVEEVTEPVVEAEEEQVIAPVVDVVEGQIDAPMMDIKEDLAVLFDDDDFEDDTFDGFSEEEVWEVNEDWLVAHTTPPSVLAVPPPSVYEVGGPSTAVAEGPSFPQVAPGLPVPPSVIEGLSTRLDNLEYGHGQLVQRVIQGSDTEIAVGVIIGEIGLRVLAVEGQMQRDETIIGLTQKVQAMQADVQQRDTQIQQLQTTITEMGSRESTLTRCILGLEKRITALQRRPPGPQ
ncbi:putative RNA-directed DNA polymerase [Tanacetum coccineum]